MTNFQALQSKLVAMWSQIGSRLTDDTTAQHTVVVIPSITVDVEFTTSALKAYEERMLYMLFLLRDPDIHLVFVTSEPVDPEIADYYLQLIPGIIISNARRRLKWVSPEDGSPAPLSEKLLARPALIRQIKALIADPDNAHMVPFSTTALEHELAVQLGIPMFAPDSDYFGFGTKTGCRTLFAEVGVRHPLGHEDLHDLDSAVDAILDVEARRPGLERVVLKLNQGVSGLGNMLIELPPPETLDKASAVREQILAKAASREEYLEKMGSEGAVVEEYVRAIESPSVQLRITPLGDVQLLSTHDQMLGGDDGQAYLGAVFPAHTDYSRLICQDALLVGRRLAQEGVLGRFAIDFVVSREDESSHWTSYAIEINLRKGGTTAPYLILQFLTDGRYDADEGVFLTADGQQRFYVASDHVEDPSYRRFTTSSLLDVVSSRGLHFSQLDQTGVVMQMMSDVGEMGRLGVTAIGRSPEDARRIFDEFAAVLKQEAEHLV
jgi:hypothetical protein